MPPIVGNPRVVNGIGTLPVSRVMDDAGTRLRRGVHLVVAAGIALAAIGVIATPAHAYTLSKARNCSTLTIKNSGSVRIVVHTRSLLGTDRQVTNLLDAIDAVTDEFNSVGGTTAHISSVTTTTASYHHNTTYDEPGTIHLGFTPVTTDEDGLTHVGQEVPFTAINCVVQSPNIGFLDLDHIEGWNFLTPGATHDDEGNTFYQAAVTDKVRHYYFRPQLLHELMHAFGLGHSANTTSFMNYGQMPWINRAPRDMITPLPDDLAALRYLYPADDDVYRVAFLNTALDPAADVSSEGAGTQSPLCRPSGGTGFASLFYTHNYACATSPFFQVCAGGQVYGAYSLANYSTSAMDVSVAAYFSVDDVWGSTDQESVDYDQYSIAAGKTLLIRDQWTIPTMLVGTQQLHVILRVVAVEDTPGAPPANSVTTDWLPLVGTLTTC
jgi:hypothetical protein